MSPRPYCAHCEGGVWIVADDGTASKCPHCAPATPPAEFHADAVGDAHPHALDAAVRIIRDAAHARATFSSNDIRDQLDHAQVRGPIVGAAFSKAAKLGVIRFTGNYTPSTDPATHRHPVKVWASRVYRGSAA